MPREDLTEKKRKLVKIIRDYVDALVTPYLSGYLYESSHAIPYFLNVLTYVPSLVDSSKFEIVPKDFPVPVAATSGDVIFFNETFLEEILKADDVNFKELSPEKEIPPQHKRAMAKLHVFLGILIHEVLHRIFKHPELAEQFGISKDQQKSFLFNVATDIYVNELMESERDFLRNELKRKIQENLSTDIKNPYLLPDFLIPNPSFIKKRKESKEYDAEYWESVPVIPGLDRTAIEDYLPENRPFSVLNYNEIDIFNVLLQNVKVKTVKVVCKVQCGGGNGSENENRCNCGGSGGGNGNQNGQNQNSQAASGSGQSGTGNGGVEVVEVEIGSKKGSKKYAFHKDIKSDRKNNEQSNQQGNAEKQTSNSSVSGRTGKPNRKVPSAWDSIKEAIVRELKSKSKGSGFIEISQKLNVVYGTTGTWKSILESFVNDFVKNKVKKTWTRLNTRRAYLVKYGILTKGEREKKTGSASFYFVVDTSGSISEEEYMKTKSLLIKALKEPFVKEVVEIQHTDQINAVHVYAKNRKVYKGDVKNNTIVKTGKKLSEKVLLERNFSGGTSHREVFDVLENSIKPGDAVIFVTDFCSDVEEIYSKYKFFQKGKVLWLITDASYLHNAKKLQKIGEIHAVDNLINRMKTLSASAALKGLKRAKARLST